MAQYTGRVKISEALDDELFFLIGRLHEATPPRECGVIRKASELYSLVKNLPRLKGDSLAYRRERLGLTTGALSSILCVSQIQHWEETDAPAWVSPLLDALEERRRDEERRDYLGVNDQPEP